jgi:hypothetical protein
LAWDNKTVKGRIEGRATGGNININGSSAVRRSGSISMVADSSIWNITNINNLISINKKVSIKIGLEDIVAHITAGNGKDDDPDIEVTETDGKRIFWFNLGHYVVAAAAVNESAQGITINITIKDFMCLLNGEIAGKLPSDITYTPMKVIGPDGNETEENVIIPDLIKTIVRDLGGVPEDNIIISGLTNRIKNTVRWNGSSPAYLIDKGKYYIFTTEEPSTGTYNTYTAGQNIGY